MRQKIFIFLCIVVVFSKCNQIDKLTQFDLKYDESIVIPSTTGVNLPFDLFTPDIETNSESSFAVNDTRKDLIEEITLSQMELVVTSPVDEDFSFLESVSIFISANGLDEVKIAWKDEISIETGNKLILDTSNQDLKEYINQDNFKLRINTVTDEILTSDYHIDIHNVFHVDANILGI